MGVPSRGDVPYGGQCPARSGEAWPRPPSAAPAGHAPASTGRAHRRGEPQGPGHAGVVPPLPRLTDARIEGPPRLGEDAAEHRLEERERERLTGGIERRTVVPGAE